MDNFDFYKNRVLAKGSTRKDIIIHEKKQSFAEYLYSIPNRYEVLVNDIDTTVAIQDASFNHDFDDKYLLCDIDISINIGNYVVWDETNWLIVSKESETIKDHQSVRMKKCNHKLKWIDNNNNLIIKPSVVSAKTLQTTGIKDEKIITIPDGMVGIQLPYDDDSKALTREKSFIFNKAKYDITFYNEIDYKGLVILVCKERLPDIAVDDVIEEIADRYDKDGNDRLEVIIIPDPPDIPLAVEYIVTSDADKLNGIFEIYEEETNVFTFHKFINGIESSGVFSFAVDNSDIGSITNQTDNTVSILGITSSKGLLKITATDDSNNEVTEIDIKILGWF